MNDAAEIVRRCADCRCVSRCVDMFGRFWPDKSRDGFGCRAPLDEEPLPAPPPPAEKPKERFVQGDLMPPPLSDEDY